MSKMSYSDYLEKILAATGGTVYWLDENCVYQGCNDNAAKMIGLKSGKEVRGLTDQDLLRFGNWGVEQANAFAADDREVIQTKQAKRNVEEPVIFDLEGNPVYFLTTRVPIFDDSGKVIGVVGTSTDITALKKAEQSLVIAKQQAEAAHQAKTEFLANMSHDVKTPLSGVIAVAELLASREEKPEAKKMLEDIGRCGKKLMSFFENCIELSKMDVTALQIVEKSFSMKQITDAIHDLFIPRATEKKILFSVHLDANLPSTFIGNKNNIYRVILNLIGNAMKFTTQGSVDLSVKLHERLEDENIIVKIVVKDTGIGIPKDKQKIIFEKLQRLTPSYYSKQEGHGIGLYIVDQYVKAMHGTVEVDSEVGQGSTFTVMLPLKVSKENVEKNMVIPLKLTEKEAFAIEATDSYVPWKSKVTALDVNAPLILLVEDNPLIQAVTKEIIQSAGAQVDVANNGQEAINLFLPEKYALIYMDIGLPDMDGYEVSQRLRAIEAKSNAAQTPILALTAHAAVDVKNFCAGAGMQGVLNKPLSCKQAQQIVECYVLRKSMQVDGLQLLEGSSSVFDAASRLEVIDLQGCVAVVESETRAKEMLSMITELLDSTFIPEIKAAYEKNDDIELRKALHKFLGSLCYVSTPALKQATLDLQAAVKEKLNTREQAYQVFLHEVRQFKIAYATLKQVGMV